MNEHVKHVSADVQQIYSRIGDNISKKIFESRLLITLTKNDRTNDETEFLRGKRNKDRRLAELFHEIKRFDGDTLIYGAGECGRYLCESDFIKEFAPVRGFIDNKEWPKEKIHNMPVYSFEDAVHRFEKANIILSMQSGVSRKQAMEQITGSMQDWKIIDAGEVLQEIDREGLLEVRKPYYKHIYDLVNTSELGAELFSKIMHPVHPAACWITFQEGDVIGKLIKEKWGYLPWQCYLTDDKRQNEYNGVPVYTYEEAADRYGQLTFIIESERERNIALQKVVSIGTESDCIDLNEITAMLYKKQYFDFFKYEGLEETFVDGGAFDLGSTQGFVEWCNGYYKRIFAFEPEKAGYKVCKEKADKWNGVSLFNCGLYDRQGVSGFTSGLGGASRIENQEQDFYSDYNIKVTDLDSVVKGELVTFIKMDIEGAEEKALLGARRIITEQKPKLAICVYHKPEDIIELPKLVLEMRPDYKIAFRHYSLRDTETVMYAW